MACKNATVCNVTETKVDNYRLYFVGVQGLLMVPIIFGNSLILMSWMKFKILRRRSNILIVNLALADIMVGLFTIPYEILSYIFPQMASTEWTCILRYALYTLFLLTSITTLLAISIERYIAIIHPLLYLKHVTGARIVVVVVTMWLVNIAYCVAPVLGWNSWQFGIVCMIHKVFTRLYRVIFDGFISFCLILNVCFYARVSVSMIRMIRKPHRDNTQCRNSSSESLDLSLRTMRANFKHTKVMLLVLGLFIVCWVPVICLASAEDIMNRNFPGLTIARTLMFATGIANSGLNWIIYGWKNTLFREKFRTLLRCDTRRSPHRNPGNRDVLELRVTSNTTGTPIGKINTRSMPTASMGVFSTNMQGNIEILGYTIRSEPG